MKANRYRYTDLLGFAAGLLRRTGLSEPMAQAMADKMLEADLLGQSSHGILFLAAYLTRIEAGHIARSGDVKVVQDHPEAFHWDAGRLAGAWTMARASAEIHARIDRHATVTATIANCSHIGCLQAYLMTFVEKGYMVVLTATNPGLKSVAPFGGTDPVLTTNPVAYGIPSRVSPLLIDYSTSLASNTFFANFAARGERLPGQWLLDAQGNATDDPTVLAARPAGTILPLGGLDFGYKGFGAGLFVEAASLALTGYGRRNAPDMFGQSVFLQVINPAFFAGQDAFLEEIDQLVTACKQSRPRPGGSGVRLPGERALQSRARQLRDGVDIAEEAHRRLQPWLQKFEIPWPEPLPPEPL